MITRYHRFLANVLVTGSLLVACTHRGGLPKQPASGLATITVGTLDAPNYDQARLTASKASEPEKKVLNIQASRGQNSLQGQVPPGSYLLQLEYLANGDVTYTSKDCDNPSEYDLKPGMNRLTIYVCDAAGQRVAVDPPEPTTNTTSTNSDPSTSGNDPNRDADLDITPIYRKPGTDKERGKLAYNEQCLACHGDKGSGAPAGPTLSAQATKRDAFIIRTANTMPPSNPSLCDQTCASDIAAYLFD